MNHAFVFNRLLESIDILSGGGGGFKTHSLLEYSRVIPVLRFVKLDKLQREFTMLLSFMFLAQLHCLYIYQRDIIADNCRKRPLS